MHEVTVRRLLIAAALVVLVLVAVVAGGCDRSSSEVPLRVGLIPNIAPEDQKAKYEPLRIYLEEVLGEEVELFVASSYTGVVQAMASGNLDIAYFGALTYVQALQQMELEPLITEIDRETGTDKYYSLIIANRETGIESMADLAGKVFAFGDVSSTSGSLYPRKMLADAGYDWEKDFAPIERVLYSGGHDATAKAVANGTADAGGIEGRILERLIRNGVVDGDAIVIIDRILVPGYPWAIAGSVSDERKERIAAAFLAIEDPELLDLLRAERYVRVGPEDYVEVIEAAVKFGLIEKRDRP